MKTINLLHHWDAIATIAWFMYGINKRADMNTLRVCTVHSGLMGESNA